MNFAEIPLRSGPVPGSVVLRMGTGRLEVQLELQPLGQDWLLLITGGQAHAGVAALSAPGMRQELAVLGNHKEGPLAAACAEVISTASGRVCAVVAGIHQEQATAGEIASIVANARQGSEELARWLAGEKGECHEPHHP